MAYNTDRLLKQAIDLIKKHKLVFLYEVISFLPCSQSTFYDHKLEQSEDIKSALEENRVLQKHKMRANWINGDNSTLQLAAYKLLSNDDEIKKLSMQHTDVTSDGKQIGLTPEQVAEKINTALKVLKNAD